MNNRTLSAVAFGAALFLALGAFPGADAAAQVGDISNVTYPGWIPSDRVDPTITVQVTCDPATDLWTYEYRVANGPAAEQDILEFKLRFEGPQTFDQIESTPPPGWWSLLSPGGAIPGATFQGRRDVPPGDVPSPSPDQIGPGSSLSGFRITSPFSPGEARTYVQGYAPVPYIKEAFGGDEEFIVPHDTTNSQRGFTIGPSGPIRPCALPFDAFDIERARVELGPGPNDDEFELEGSFTLGSASNGIDPPLRMSL